MKRQGEVIFSVDKQREIEINDDLGDIKCIIAERDFGQMRDDEARQGDILRINKDREREREKWGFIGKKNSPTMTMTG